jgi:peptidoglycan hydrolase CwlO-like protein
MLKKAVAILVAGSALTLGLLGVMSLGVSAASASTTAPHCTNAQLKVNVVAAKLTAAQARLALLQAKLATATSKNKTTRVQKIQARITKVNARIAKLTARLQAIEQACQVQPSS